MRSHCQGQNKMNKKLLLLIEDNPLLNGMYKSAFEKRGVEVLFAHDGETGINVAKEKNPDVVLLDILMPGIDGLEVLERLKKDEATKHIKIVILTIVKKEDAMEKAKKLGAIDYLVKSELKLQEIVDKVLLHFNNKQ